MHDHCREHEHSHDHAHKHDHPHDHEHAPEQGHKQTHAHEHASGQGHGHEHDHEHTHGSEHAAGQKHAHADTHAHGHCHGHGHAHQHGAAGLVLRPYTGISGDIMVAGLARMLEADQALIDGMIAAIDPSRAGGLPELAGGLSVQPHSLHEVGGWQCRVTLPHEHSHRTLTDIRGIIQASAMEDTAKTLAEKAFTILAEAEGAVHGKETDAVAFHEVGALDSILDTCLAAALFAKLAPARFVCGSLPVCDGTIRCAHGALPAPAPAVMRLLRDVPVHGIASQGETVTPTGLALLKAFGAEFGPWPAVTIEREALVYGTRVFENVPNGAIFAYGKLQ